MARKTHTAVQEESQQETPSSIYRALRDFSLVVDGTYLHFDAGALINDFTMIQQLLKHSCPIVPEDGAVTVVCPFCKNHFPFNADE